MVGTKPTSTTNKTPPPAAWIALLDTVEAAEEGQLNLDGGTAEVVALAERLVDLGFLRVPRASYYSVTPAGKDLLQQARCRPVSIRIRRRIPLFLFLSLATLAMGLIWLWPDG